MGRRTCLTLWGIGLFVGCVVCPSLAFADSGPDVNWFFAPTPEVYMNARYGVPVTLAAFAAVVAIASLLALLGLRRLANEDAQPGVSAPGSSVRPGDGRVD
jgi:hypothetical protein